MRSQIRLFLISTVVFVCAHTSALAADKGKAPAQLDGKALYAAKMCQTCHGPTGNAPIAPMYPKIAGQSVVYIETQLKDIKSGKRNNGMTATMKPFMMNVSDEEISAIAKFLSESK